MCECAASWSLGPHTSHMDEKCTGAWGVPRVARKRTCCRGVGLEVDHRTNRYGGVFEQRFLLTGKVVAIGVSGQLGTIQNIATLGPLIELIPRDSVESRMGSCYTCFSESIGCDPVDMCGVRSSEAGAARKHVWRVALPPRMVGRLRVLLSSGVCVLERTSGRRTLLEEFACVRVVFPCANALMQDVRMRACTICSELCHDSLVI